MTRLSNEANEKRQSGAEARGYGQGGPVFLPRRRLSPLAQTLLTGNPSGEGVTAYDEPWYALRPLAS